MNLRPLLTALVLSVAALGARAEVFYTLRENDDVLCTIDTSTLVITPIGALGIPSSFGDLAWDSSTGTLYLSNGWGAGGPSSLYTVNTSTGAATLVGAMGVSDVFGLVYDPSTNKLFATRSTLGTGFYEVNRSSGVATLIGDPGHYLDGMTYVGSTNDLVGIYAGPGSVHAVNRATGASSLLSPGGGFVDNCGIGWGAASNRVYSIDWSGGLYAYDVASGYARTTLTSGLGSFDGLASKDACTAPSTYCTAKTNSLGCTPSIGATGTPSATAPSGFVVTGTNVRNQKAGLLFYGTSGPASTPFQGGTLCVKTPVRRTPVVNSGGTALPTNNCTGVYSVDMNTFAQGGLGGNPSPALLVVGTVVNCQWWGRDPGFPAPNNTTLTGGLEYTVCP